MMGPMLSSSRVLLIALGVLGVGLANACSSSGDGDGGDPSGTGTGGNTTTSTNTNTGGGPGSGGSGGGTGGSGGQGGGSAVVCDPAEGQMPGLQLVEVASGFERSLFVTSEPNDPNRLLVVEQTGRIMLVDSGVVLNEPFLDVSSLVEQPSFPGAEFGLLGLALHPDYESNGRFYIYYAADIDGLPFIVEEYRRSQGNPDIADPATRTEIFRIDPGPGHPHYGNHNGGVLAFGPDGHLYIGVGDGGGSGDPNDNGQNMDVRLGKILRVDVDNPQVAPPGNMTEGDPFIWDTGLRNPWRMSFDSCTGDLYIGDVGQGSREEINVEPAGQGNKNYGWNTMEGSLCFEPPQGCDMTGKELPVVEFSHQTGEGCSITGGYVYRGSMIPALRGTYLFGDFCDNWIRSLVWQDGALISQADLTSELQSMQMIQGLASFGEDAAGELYVVDLAGVLFRIEPE